MQLLQKIAECRLTILALLLLSGFYYVFSYHLIIFKSMTPQSHRLSATTDDLLKQCTAPFTMTLHTKDIDTYHAVKILIERYQLTQPALGFHWVKNAYPFSANYTGQALEISLNQQKQVLDLELIHLDEAHLSQALFRLQRKINQWAVFLQGHGEPDIYSTLPKDMALFRTALENQGLKIQALHLPKTQVIPNNTQLFIIATPKTTLLPLEETLIARYIAQGNDLLWLVDPHSTPIDSLNQVFGVQPLKGTIIDLHGQKLKTPHPAITIIEHYPALPFSPPAAITAFPFSAALSVSHQPGWTLKPLLTTDEQSWTETSELAGSIGYEPEKGDMAGPLTLGVYLTRIHPLNPQQQQRIAIIGNSRFLTNGAIQNYGNLAFGLNLCNWLHHDDALLALSQPLSQDSMLQMHLFTAVAIQYLMPLFSVLLLIFALVYYYHRSNKHRYFPSHASSLFNKEKTG